ncbi:MAG: alpha/beta fold hydrolase [Rhodoferax sp.]
MAWYVILAVLVGSYYLLPIPVAQAILVLARRLAGLQRKTLRVGAHDIVYLEAGTGAQTILLVHGFSGAKEQWLRWASLLKGYRVVIPDLLGHGESSKPHDGGYDIASQVALLHQFTQALGLTRFHIAGNSMGGRIAASYALHHPQQLRSLALLAASGVKPLQPSVLEKMHQRGEPLFVVGSRKDMRFWLEMAFSKVPFTPYPLFELAYQTARAQQQWNQKMLAQILPDAYTLEPDLPRIATPTLVLWGSDDRLLDISSVPVYARGLPQQQTVVLQHCGHCPMLEQPQQSASAYLDFLKPLS